MLDIDLYNMFRKRVSSSALPFNSWAYHLCLNCLLSCRLCLEELVPGETGGKSPIHAMFQGDTSSDDETVDSFKDDDS